MVASLAVDFACNYAAESVMFLSMPNDFDEINVDEETTDNADDIDNEVDEVKPTRTTRRPKNYRPSARARTIAPKELLRAHKKAMGVPVEEDDTYPNDVERPLFRGDCHEGGINEQRPCPFVSCAHHLYLDANRETGALKMNFPHLEVWDMTETCALDVAERGGITLEEVGEIMNLTRERIRQVEVRGLSKAGFQYEVEHGCKDCGSEMSFVADIESSRGLVCIDCGRTVKEPA